jgi:hypothetical protein
MASFEQGGSTTEIARTAEFYRLASGDVLDKFEDALDHEDVELANAIREEFFSQASQKSAGKYDRAYLEEEPKVGDMVFVNTINRHARLIAISDDGKKALVKEMWGCYPVDYDKLRRVR